MPEVDDCQELEVVGRHELPKRRLNNKYLQRFRNIYKGDGDVIKIMLIEGPFDFSSFTEKQKAILEMQIKEKLEGGNYGMNNFYMNYSLGKRKRWELIGLKADELPVFPDPIASISMLKFTEQRSMHCRASPMFRHNRGFVYAFFNENPCWRYPTASLSEYSVKTEDKAITRKGKFNRKQRILEVSEPAELTIHIQYHVTEFKMNRKWHNSEKHRFWHDSRDQYCKPMVEGCRLNADVIKLPGGYETAIWEFNGTHFDQLDPEIEEFDSETETPKAKGLTLADFLVPIIKKQRKRTTSDQWVFV